MRRLSRIPFLVLAGFLATTGVSRADYIPGTLVSYWPLDETDTSSTIVLDHSPNDNDGTLRQGTLSPLIASISPDWKPGMGPVIDSSPTDAVGLNGSNEFFMLPQSSSLDWDKSAGTISLWVNSEVLARQSILRDTNEQMSIEVTGTSGGGNYRIYFNPNRASSDTAYFMTNVSLTPGTWQHLVFTWDISQPDSGDPANPNKVKAWVNGVAQTNFNAEGNNVDTGWVFPATTGDWFLGRRLAEPTRYFMGDYAEVAFFDKALSSVEVSTLETAGVNASDPDLVGYWNFGEGVGTSTADLSPNGNEMALVETDFPVAERTGPVLVDGGGPTIDSTTVNALQLDGSNDVALLPASPSLAFDKTKGTISLWLNSNLLDRQSIFRDTSSSISIEVTGSSAGHRIYFHPNGINNSNNYFMTTAPLTPGTWQHLVFAWDFTAADSGIAASPNKVKAWVDGVPQANYNAGGNNVDTLWTSVPKTSNWIIGSRFGDPFRFFNGRVAELAIFDTNLDNTAVSDLFATGVDTSNPDLVAYFPFAENSGTRVADASTNSNELILGEPAGPGFPVGLGANWVTAAPAGKPGYISRALDFTGNDGLFIAPDSPSLDFDKSQGTIVMLAYFRSNNRFGLIGDSSRGIEAEAGSSSAGRIFFNPNHSDGSANYFMTNAPRTLNSWMHVAFVWDISEVASGDSTQPNKVKVYFDGVPQENIILEGNDVDALWQNPATTADWVVGRRADLNDTLNSRYFDGEMADMAIFNNALPPADVDFIADNGVAAYLLTAPTPTPSPSPSPSPSASATPTESPSPTATETPSPSPTETATPLPTDTATPVPTATMTVSPTVSVSPTPTPTASPSPSPSVTPTPVEFDFVNDQEGWEFFNPTPLFATVTGTYNNAGGSIDTTTQENTDSFGFWESPIFVITQPAPKKTTKVNGIPIAGLIGSQALYRSVFTIKSSTNTAATVPAVRIRSSSFNFEQTDAIVITSSQDGSLSPTTTERSYTQYFTQPSETDSFRLDFDVLNFDPTDAAVATLALTNVTVEALAVPTAVGTAIASYDFTGGDAHGFTPRTASPLLAVPAQFDSTSGLLIRGEIPMNNKGVAMDGTIFGYWGSETNVPITGGAFYGVTFTARSSAASAEKATIPTFRMRVNDSTLKFASFINLDSINGTSRVPVDGNPETYLMFFQAPSEIDGGTFIFSFDYLYSTTSNDDPTVAVTLDGLSITQFDNVF